MEIQLTKQEIDLVNSIHMEDIEEGLEEESIASASPSDASLPQAADDVFLENGAPEDDEAGEDDAKAGGRFGGMIYRATINSSLALPTFANASHTQQNRVTRDARKLLSDINGWAFREILKYSVWTLWAMVLAFSMGLSSIVFPDGNNPTCDEANGSRNKAACDTIASLNRGASSLAILTSFVLGGFLLSSRQLWLARRTAYCALCGATRNLIINLTTLAPQEEKHVLARWASLGYELSVLKGRMLIDSDEARDFLTRGNLIAEDEWDAMVNGDRHTTVWYWIQTKAKQMKDEGKISDIELQTLCNAVTLSRDKANDLMSCLDRDQPPPYVFVCGMLVNLNLFFQSTARGVQWSVWVNDAGARVWTEPRLYTDLLFLLLYTTMFALLFDVCAVLYNPFGPRDIDIPHNVVGRGIRLLAMSLASKEYGEDKGLPQTMILHENEAEFAGQISQVDLGHISGQANRTTLLPSFGRGGPRRRTTVMGRRKALGRKKGMRNLMTTNEESLHVSSS